MAAIFPPIRWGTREVSWTWIPETTDELVRTARPLLAEMLGTLVFVFAAGSLLIVVPGVWEAGSVGLLSAALGTAIAYAIIVSVFYPVSGGHINPAVTIGLVAARRMPPSIALGYIGAQVSGALLGGLFLQFFYRDVVAEAAKTATLAFERLSGTWPALWTGGFLEAVLTFVLVLAYFSTLVDRRANRALGGFGVGLVMLLAMLIALPLTGAALNVARVFGTAAVASHWTHFGMYWLGLAGGLLAGLVYEYLFAPSEEEA